MLALSTELRDHLELQHGLVTLQQCRDDGMARAQLRTLVRSGRFTRLAPGVYGLADRTPSWHRSLWLAHLHAGPDSCISHQAAARLHGCEEAPEGALDIICRTNARHGPDDVRRHIIYDLATDDIEKIDGLPATNLVRTIIDLAAVMHIATLRTLFKREIIDGRVTAAQVGSRFAELRQAGKPGVVKLCRLLDDVGPGEGLARSRLEQLLDEVLRRSGLPTPEHEYPLPGRGAVTGFVDRCWPEAQWIVEADGRKWHTRQLRMEHDATRRTEAQTVGFETTSVMWEHLTADPDGMARMLRRIYEQRVALLGHRSA